MNSGVTSERVYDALKRRLLAGELQPGEKLEPARFAEELNSSVTPVRDALHRLTGERLIEARTSDGFHVPLVTEPGLRDLYTWHHNLVRLAIANWQEGARAPSPSELPIDLTRATPQFFRLIADRSENAEHGRQVAAAGDRLAAIRIVEPMVLSDLEAELRDLAVSLDTAPAATLVKQIGLYHRRRSRAVPAIVRYLYRG